MERVFTYSQHTGNTVQVRVYVQHFYKKPFLLGTALFKQSLVEGVQKSRMREESLDCTVGTPSCIPQLSDQKFLLLYSLKC